MITKEHLEVISNMAARNWTPEQRARQSEQIHHWKPWQQSTGARTPEGMAASSLNAYRGNWRPLVRFAGWLSKQATRLCEKPIHVPTPETIVEAVRRGKACGIDLTSEAQNIYCERLRDGDEEDKGGLENVTNN
jgi:hypothetical protein